ncbi:MAG: universal stress protein [Acidobacteria bacterium]|nr:universal stress protein [Acidobacteriota bacterium]
MARMAHHILVPTDFSEASNRALELARQIAAAFSAEIHLLHVRILLEDPHVLEEGQRQLEQLLTRVDQKTREALATKTASSAGYVIHTHLVRGLSAPESIIQAGVDIGCDLVVMGTHGRRGLKRFFLGSVTEHVVRISPVPVMTVRPDTSVARLEGGQILVPYDFSHPARTILPAVAGWARAFNAGIRLLHVVEPLVYPEFYAVDLMPEDMIGTIRQRAEENLRTVADEFLPGLDVTTQVLTGHASETLAQEASPDRCTLVIMPTRGLSALEHLLLGSVAQYVVRHATVPVLTLRAEKE